MAQSVRFSEEGASVEELRAYLNDFGAWVSEEFDRKFNPERR